MLRAALLPLVVVITILTVGLCVSASEASENAFVPSSPDIAITGRVLGPDGEPASKAEVRLESIPSFYDRARLRMKGRSGPDVLSRARTRADGTFEIRARDLGMYKVVVSASGMLTMELRLVPLVDDRVLPDVTLPKAKELEVRLRDREGRPLPGWVGVHSNSPQGMPWQPLLRLERTDNDGVIRLRQGEGEALQLEALADGHPLVVKGLEGQRSVNLVVPEGIPCKLRVIGQGQRPASEVVAIQGTGLVPLGLSDADGLIDLVIPATGPTSVRFSSAERWSGTTDIDPKSPQESPQTVPLDPPQTVQGQVLGQVDRKPVAGAIVWAFRGESVLTDAEGRYTLSSGLYRSPQILAIAAGYEASTSQLSSPDADEAPPIHLEPLAALSGRVVDAQGRGLEGVEIQLGVIHQGGSLPPSAYRLMNASWWGRTQRRGEFRLPQLSAGVAFRLTFKADGFAPQTLRVAPLEALEARTGIEVVLTPGRLGFGRVVDPDDHPVSGAAVYLEDPPEGGDLMNTLWTVGRADSKPEPSAYTDSEGRFEIPDLATGAYDLEVRASGFAPAGVPGIRLSEGTGPFDLGTIGLIHGVTIEGMVRAEDGAAIQGAEILVNLEQQPWSLKISSESPQPIYSDAAGRFTVSDLVPERTMALFVTKEGYSSAVRNDLKPPLQEPLTFVLQPAGRLIGKVVDVEGQPVQAMVLANREISGFSPALLMQSQKNQSQVNTEDDGTFVLEDVEPGTLTVTVQSKSYIRQRRSGLELEAGAELKLEFVLERGAEIEGTVRNADGEPASQMSVAAVGQRDGSLAGDGAYAFGQTDTDGRYRITGAPLGPTLITVNENSKQRLAKAIELRPGRQVVDLVLERGYEVSGQVVNADGQPVAGAAVSIQEATPVGVAGAFFAPTQGVSSADGAFTLENISAGKYVVSASMDSLAPALSEPFVVSGDVSGLLLEMHRGATLKGKVIGLELEDLSALILTAVSQEGSGVSQGRVDFTGDYVFDGLAFGKWFVQAQVGGLGNSASLQVEIPEGVPVLEKDIEFGEGVTLTGLVLDGDQPMVDVSVVCSSTEAMGTGVTGSEGRFRIENLRPGSYQVMVFGGTSVLHTQALELTDDQELSIELATGEITGVVRDAASGAPLSGVDITLERLDVENGSFLDRQTLMNGHVQSDSTGAFRVRRVRPGTWRLVGVKSGYAPVERTVAMQGGHREVEFQMTATEGVTFGVVSESGTPLNTVHAVLLDASGRRLASGSYTVIDGKVTVSTVPPGRWELVLQGGDSATTRVPVDSPGDQGSFVLRKGGILNIRVPELEKEPAASVQLTGPDGKPLITPIGLAFAAGEWFMNSGEATVTSLVPGVWTFTVRHADGRAWSGSATVTAGATVEVVLQ